MRYKLLILLTICVYLFCSSCNFFQNLFPVDEEVYDFIKVLFPGDDFESDTFASVWETGGDAFWAVTGSDAYEGSCSFQSGDIDDNESTYVEIRGRFIAGDFIRFYHRISSEYNDIFKFFVNNDVKASGSGSQPWHEINYEIRRNGVYTLRWEYSKDSYHSNALDCVWIDNVERIPAD